MAQFGAVLVVLTLYCMPAQYPTSHFASFDFLQWPFVRVFGIQEPASVVFSLLNAVTVAVGYWHFSTHSPPNNPLYRPLVAQFVVSWQLTLLCSCRSTFLLLH